MNDWLNEVNRLRVLYIDIELERVSLIVGFI